jgi:hypothetical protein
VAAGANPLIVITDPSDPEAVGIPCCTPQDTLLRSTVTLLSSQRYCCLAGNLHQ